MIINVKKNENVIALELELKEGAFVVCDSNMFTFKGAKTTREIEDGNFYVVDKSLIDKFDIETQKWNCNFEEHLHELDECKRKDICMYNALVNILIMYLDKARNL